MQQRRETRLSKFIRENEISITRLAQESGISRRAIFYFKAGEYSPTIERAAALAEACSVITGRSVGVDEIFDVRRREVS